MLFLVIIHSLRIGWELAKSYGDFFYPPISLLFFFFFYYYQNFLLTARLFAHFSSDSKAKLLPNFLLTAGILAKQQP